MDDAGVMRIAPDLALVQTLDFFQPIVNEPRIFGRTVAANSLSDVWAMGARALTAMNILAYPSKKLPVQAIEELLVGASEKLAEANVVLVGGHTMDQSEIFYGMSVTGLVHPGRILTNANAHPGDVLILTKALGTAVYGDANSKDALTAGQYTEFVSSMERLNMYASQVLQRHGVSAMTDVTGFGLLGHALPIARNSGVTLRIHAARVPLFRDAIALRREHWPPQTWKSRDYVEPHLQQEGQRDANLYALLMEPQTSGGLLAAVPSAQADGALRAIHEAGDTVAAVIGEVVPLVTTGEGKNVYLSVVAT